MKKYTIITIIVIEIILGFLTGVYLYKVNQISNEEKTLEIAEVEDECTEIARLRDNGELDLIKTNSEATKTSPNCILTLKTYYANCGHLIEKKENIKTTEVNMTEEELKEKFNEWEIQQFIPTEIVMYKEIDEYCNEHYLLKNKDGYISIYSLDENNKEEFIETTDISIEYLTEKDLENIENGIIIYTKKELNKAIEDFE